MNGNKVQPPLPSSTSSMASVCLSIELGEKFLLFNFFLVCFYEFQLSIASVH